MASLHHTVPSPTISDVLTLLCTMKNQNDKAMKEILTKNGEILTKLNSIEEDNRKLRQELLEIKSSLKHKDNDNSLLLRKRNQSEDKAEHENEQSNTNKKARVSVASLPLLDLPASFDSLDDDCFGNVLDFVGKKCYSAFGRVNKRCHEIFCLKGLKKETYLYGYAPFHLIQQRRAYRFSGFSIGILHYNRMDILDWMLADESVFGYYNLKCLCERAIDESRLDILLKVFQRANTQQLEYLRGCVNGNLDLCLEAAASGKLECLKLLRENECEWDGEIWYNAKQNGHEHILEYLRDNGYPTEWQVDSDSDSESDD